MSESSGGSLSEERGPGGKDKPGVHYIGDQDPSLRWRAQYFQWQEREAKLTALSKLDYEPVDYESQMERVPFHELPVPDYSYMLEEAQMRADKQYRMPIAGRIFAILLLVLLMLALYDVAWIGILILPILLVAFNLYRTVQRRQRDFYRAVADAQNKINLRHEMHRTMQNEARILHEEAEDERIRIAERLIDGNTQAVLAQLESVLPKKKFPFTVTVDIDLHEQAPRIKIWFPPKAIIPRETAELLPGGKVEYQDKDPLTFNKQYLEVCSSAVMHIASRVFATIPSFQYGCVLGWVKDDLEDRCVLAATFTRQELIDACQAYSGFGALQRLGVKVDCDTTLGLGPVEPLRPVSWGEAQDKVLWSRRIII
ncbi:MAG TPA: hypothetical protein VN611_05755 [Patescibacteria group bacterium]|nr:hypothetical protein [Patescibacteria group bacterium]